MPASYDARVIRDLVRDYTWHFETVAAPYGTEPEKVANLICRAVSRAGKRGYRYVSMELHGERQMLTYSLAFRADLAPGWWHRVRAFAARVRASWRVRRRM